MKVVRCVFRGTSRRDSTGIVVTGNRARDVVIEDCQFERLAVGVDVDAGHPAMRRSVFGNISGAGVIIRCDEGQTVLSQFDGNDPRVGFNTFLPTLDGPAVINECEPVVNMERNDWGVDVPTPEAIEEVIVGNVNYGKFLQSGAAVFSGALFATVWDARNQAPILNAKVSIRPANSSTVTDNEEGVYAFPVIGSGSYDMVVTAPLFETKTQTVTVSDGQLLSVTVTMQFNGVAEGEGDGAEGEGEGEDPGTGGCPCNSNNKLGPPQPGDMMLSLMVFATLLASAWSVRRQAIEVRA
jgi:hypothetical protein